MKKLVLLIVLMSTIACNQQSRFYTLDDYGSWGLSKGQPFKYSVTPEFDQPNNIQAYLCKVGSGITNHSLDGIHDLSDWEAVRSKRYWEFLEMMGLQDQPMEDERPPLNVTRTGVTKGDGYRIEKLYYESLPGLYVPANLYIPQGIKKPVPAILYVCGHSPTQKYHYQSHAISFAKNGFVCLIIETIQFGEVRGDHHGIYSKGWFDWYSKGYNPGGVELWNGIRGLDLLSELPEVDENRLGVTGISGGGSQSWYLPAADPRVKAAAPAAGAGSLEGQICQSTIDDHCDCMMPINTYQMDFTDVGALIAPRAFMIAETTNDLYYSVEAVRDLYDKIKPIYRFYGKEENLTMKEAPGPHSYGTNDELRADILSFFYKELMGKEISPEQLRPVETAEKYTEEALKVYTDGPPKNDRTTTIQDSFVELATPPEIKNSQQLEDYRQQVVTFLQEKTFGAFPEKPEPLDIRLEYQYANKGGTIGKKFSFVSEEGWRLKVDLRIGQPSEDKKPVLLVLNNPLAERWSSYALTSGSNSKMMIATFDARGIGETGWSPAYQWHIRRSAAWTGRTIASMRVYDVLRCLEVLRKIPEVDADNIHIVAEGEMAAIAAYVGLMDQGVKTLLLKDPPATQNAHSRPDGTGMAIEMLNCLRITDLPQVTGLMYPREIVSIGDWPESYDWVKRLYDQLGRGNFKHIEKPGEWLDD